MQCNSTRFTTGTLLKFLGFITLFLFLGNYPACRPAPCKKFQQSQLGQRRKGFWVFFLFRPIPKPVPCVNNVVLLLFFSLGVTSKNRLFFLWTPPPFEVHFLLCGPGVVTYSGVCGNICILIGLSKLKRVRYLSMLRLIQGLTLYQTFFLPLIGVFDSEKRPLSSLSLSLSHVLVCQVISPPN